MAVDPAIQCWGDKGRRRAADRMKQGAHGVHPSALQLQLCDCHTGLRCPRGLIFQPTKTICWVPLRGCHFAGRLNSEEKNMTF